MPLNPALSNEEKETTTTIALLGRDFFHSEMRIVDHRFIKRIKLTISHLDIELVSDLFHGLQDYDYNTCHERYSPSIGSPNASKRTKFQVPKSAARFHDRVPNNSQKEQEKMSMEDPIANRD